MGVRRRRVKRRNMYKGFMDKDGGRGGIKVESGDWVRQGRVIGGKWGQL